jgi:RNA polymerase primary sigma factor
MATTSKSSTITGSVHSPQHVDEHALVLAARAGGGREREELIERLLPRIAGVARDYRGVSSVTREELMQAGVMGVLRALARYDPTRPNQFWTYARWWVRQAMQELVSSLSHAVVLSDRAARHLARVKAARRDHVQTRGREPSTGDLAALTGLKSGQVTMLLGATAPARALDDGADSEHPRARSLAESLPDPASEDPFEHAALRMAAHSLPTVLATLTSRELAIIRGRYGLDGEPRALADLAAELRVSKERVRQIEEAAMDKLRVTCDVAAAA